MLFSTRLLVVCFVCFMLWVGITVVKQSVYQRDQAIRAQECRAQGQDYDQHLRRCVPREEKQT